MPLFHALTMEGLIVATFICALSGHHHNLAGFGFMDDMDLCVNDSTVIMCKSCQEDATIA